MKYYAVTDDPRELYHYGVKGMKWGQHIFGDKPKSPGYRKALGKLRSSAQKKIATIRKDVETRSDNRYQKQLAKAIKRSQISQQKYGWDQVRSAVKADDKALRNAHKAELAEIKRGQYVNNANAKAAVATSKYERRAVKTAAKNAIKAAKAEKNFDKYLQAAREGRLRAGNLSDDQLQRINARLNAERQARQAGGTEKAKFGKRFKAAIGEGVLQGVTRGIGAGMEEVARAKVQNNIYSKHVLNEKNKNEAKRQKKANQIRNKKSHHEIDQEVKQRAYEARIESGENIFRRNNPMLSTARQAKRITAINDEKSERARIMEQSKRAANKSDEEWNNYLESNGITDLQARAGFHGKRAASTTDPLKQRQQRAQILRAQKQFEDALNAATFQAFANNANGKGAQYAGLSYADYKRLQAMGLLGGKKNK